MKKIIPIFILLGLAVNSLAVVSTLQKAQQTIKEAEDQATQADKNIKEAQHLLDTGSLDQAKKAIKKVTDSSAITKKHIQSIGVVAKEATNKMEDIAATTSQSKQLTQEVKNEVKKVKDTTKEIHSGISQTAAANKKVQEAQITGNTQQAKKHTDKVAGLLQDLERKVKEFGENIEHVYQKAKNADEAAKTQVVLVSPNKDVKYGPRVRTVMRPEAVDEEWD